MINTPSGLTDSEASLYITIFQKCRDLIEAKGNSITLTDAVDAMMSRFGGVVEDRDQLQKFLLEEVKVPINPVVTITDHAVKDKKWFSILKQNNRSKLEYWNRYHDYLNHKPSWSLDAVADIDESTDAVLNYMADPSLGTKQNVYGLAFGYVQSGKTAHYIGVLNKAVDAGYKIIIVLSGIHNNLRSQTQIRLEEEFLGYDVRGSEDDSLNAIGVGIGENNKVTQHLNALTSREEKGDFNKKTAGTAINPPLLVVTKKNGPVLNRLIKYLSDLPMVSVDDKGRKRFSSSYPLLLIDDEADQASLNTKDCYNDDGTVKKDFDPTVINKRIRQLLMLFDCYSYVGYTATPFANIFIPPKITSDKYGKDLFPKDFIVNIPRPSNYIGALEYFGLTDGDETIKAMPLYREIKSGKDYLGKGTKKDDFVGEIPEELKTAVKSFVIAVATRNLRGHYKSPNTMLIHIIRYKQQQNTLKKKVEKYFFEEIVNYIKNNDPDIKQELKQIWDSDYSLTTQNMRQNYPKYMNGLDDFSWDEIYAEIVRFIKAKEYTVYCVNGDSADTLIYNNHKGEPFNVIVIGGDKLSRGLTLEGLIVSYFTRTSNAYDTLMQMGRWFGFRPGYLDLCRLYTTKTLHGYFVDISRATEDLVRQIEYMGNVVKQTPMEFGLAVESNPDLLITSRTKMRTGEDMKRDFSNHLSQTRIIDIDSDQFDENFNAVETLLYSVGNPADVNSVKTRVHSKAGKHHYYWFDVDGYDVAQFLESYKTSSSATRANSKYMSDYVKNQMKVQGLTNWTICLINYQADGRKPFDIANLKGVGAGITRDIAQFTDGDSACDIHTLLSKDQEYMDYTETQFSEVKKMQEEGKKADKIREATRSRDHGLLLLYPIGNVKPLTDEMDRTNSKTPFGFAVVFPDRQGQGDLKSYHINDIAVENKSNDFDA